MPVEIKELHIRVAVNAQPGPAQGDAGNASASGGQQGGDGAKAEQMLADCVEQILQVLQNKSER